MDFYPPGSRIASRYEVASLPKMGGMGIVYICFDHLEQHPIALKTFRPEYLSDRVMRDRFLRQGTTWLELGKHPHIVRCYGVEHIGDGTEVYLVLEFVAKQDGREDASLRSWLVPGNAMRVEQALLFGLQVARGMKYALEKIPGFVHRDLKPENVLVGADKFGDTNINRVRVTDFDLVSVVQDLGGQGVGNKNGTSSNLIRTQLSHGIAGTPHYMAPEQWKGEGICVQTDMYALGCIMYEMLAGQRVVDGMSESDLKQAHLEGKLRSFPRGLPDVVTGLVHRCLEKKPQDRFGDWRQVESVIGSAYRQVSGQAIPAAGTSREEDRDERVAMGQAFNALGLSYSDIGKPAVAKTYFERVLTTGQTEHDLALEVVGLANLGSAYHALGDARKAIVYWEQSLAIARESGYRNMEGSTLGNLGLAYRDLGDPRRAIEYFKQSLEIARETGDRNGEGNALNNLGFAYSDLGDAHRAIEYSEQSLAIFHETGDRNGEGGNLNNLGLAYQNLGDARKAIEYFEQSLTIACEIGDLKGEGQSLGNLGGAYHALGDTRKAIEYYEQSLDIARETGDRNGEGKALNNLGVANSDLGDTRKAIEYHEQSLAIARETGNRNGEGGNLNNLGSAYDDLGDPSRAIEYYEQALAIFRETGNRNEEGNALNNLGVSYQALGDTHKAIEYYEQSLDIARETSDRNGEGSRLNNLGLAYYNLGVPHRAIEYYEQGLATTRETGDQDGEGRTLGALGDVYANLGEKKKARACLEQALVIFKAISSPMAENVIQVLRKL